MSARRLIVIGASAGGVQGLARLVADLPADIPAAICVVVHFPPTSTSVLPKILRRAGALPATHARDAESLEEGHIYVAPPDNHLIVVDAVLQLRKSARVNRNRPAIDPLFWSAARAYGPHAIGLILSGNLDDGTAGLLAIKRHGGMTIVQDPEDALHPEMPRTAMETVVVDYVRPLSQLGALLAELANRDGTERPTASRSDTAVRSVKRTRRRASSPRTPMKGGVAEEPGA